MHFIMYQAFKPKEFLTPNFFNKMHREYIFVSYFTFPVKVTQRVLTYYIQEKTSQKIAHNFKTSINLKAISQSKTETERKKIRN